MGGRPRRGWAARLRSTLRRGAADQGGAAAVFFAISLLLLAPLTLGLVDVYMSTTQRGQLQDALDAATLYVARSSETDAAKIKQMGYEVLQANLNLPSGQTVAAYNFELVDGRKVVSSAAITPPSFAPALWEQNNLQANSEVTRNSNNLEVAVVLDVTGSMRDDMDDLKLAAKELVDIVVQDSQTPYYSRMGLVPYDQAVRVGATIAPLVRGAQPSKLKFKNADSNRWSSSYTEFNLTPCVSERTGTEAYSDAFPNPVTNTQLVGSVYGNCLGAEIVPLTSNKLTLKGKIDALDDGGSTAGHIGLAWGWYLVSPNFKTLWPGSSIAAYPGPNDELVKVVVLMTDGAFNTQYCGGVPDRNSTAIGKSSRAYCTAPNGSAFTQATELCKSIKAKKIVLYTVGFDIGSDATATNFINSCATSSEHVFLPSSGKDLREAFKAIGADINRLRISK